MSARITDGFAEMVESELGKFPEGKYSWDIFMSMVPGPQGPIVMGVFALSTSSMVVGESVMAMQMFPFEHLPSLSSDGVSRLIADGVEQLQTLRQQQLPKLTLQPST